MTLMNTVESSAVESLCTVNNTPAFRLLITLNVTSQKRDKACFVLNVSLGISGLKTREPLVACQYVRLPNDFLA